MIYLFRSILLCVTTLFINKRKAEKGLLLFIYTNLIFDKDNKVK